jgi:hypothetical protein
MVNHPKSLYAIVTFMPFCPIPALTYISDQSHFITALHIYIMESLHFFKDIDNEGDNALSETYVICTCSTPGSGL